MVTTWTKTASGAVVWSHGTSVGAAEPKIWTTATRPAAPYDGQTGKNTDIGGLETWDAALNAWKILSGVWTTATRPTGIAQGSTGYNTDAGYGVEVYDGSEWQLL